MFEKIDQCLLILFGRWNPETEIKQLRKYINKLEETKDMYEEYRVLVRKQLKTCDEIIESQKCLIEIQRSQLEEGSGEYLFL